ncbi:hypothetical protein RvY_13308 [Ramazzottius varieornatus]|uniref:Uncharacterized protein n=1 Tax=Ramazzottius varieornatus TaxID=947166 RepID=A0A1D1VUX9_RAMVA|nr:hypothetical protein RvY_13308 [Ramazzottius varieornatus]
MVAYTYIMFEAFHVNAIADAAGDQSSFPVVTRIYSLNPFVYISGSRPHGNNTASVVTSANHDIVWDLFSIWTKQDEAEFASSCRCVCLRELRRHNQQPSRSS